VARRLLLLTVVLGGASLACAAFIVWELAAPAPAREVRRPPAGPPAAAPAPQPPRAPASSYNVVTTRNVFSPTRTEGPALPGTGAAALAGPKPNLHGVLLRDQNPIAYIEDPMTKRVAAYRVGDPVGGGTLTSIAADRVIIARPDGPLDVRLRDPSKPRPAPAPAAPPSAGVFTPTPGGLAPGVMAPGAPGPGAPGAQAQPPGGPQIQQLPPGLPGSMGVGPFGPGVGGRPFPGRRLPVPAVPGTPPTPPPPPQ
jgi:hypothetical protein